MARTTTRMINNVLAISPCWLINTLIPVGTRVAVNIIVGQTNGKTMHWIIVVVSPAVTAKVLLRTVDERMGDKYASTYNKRLYSFECSFVNFWLLLTHHCRFIHAHDTRHAYIHAHDTRHAYIHAHIQVDGNAHSRGKYMYIIRRTWLLLITIVRSTHCECKMLYSVVVSAQAQL